MDLPRLRIRTFAFVALCVARASLGSLPLEGTPLPRLGDGEIGTEAVMAKAYSRLLAAAEAPSEDSSQALLQLAQFYHANAFLPQALQSYDRLSKTGSREEAERARYLAACVAEAMGDREMARRRLESFLDGGPAYSPARLRLARLLVGLVEQEQAVSLLQECLDYAETEEGAAIELAKLDLRAGALRAAESRLRDCLQRHPDSGDAALLLSNVYAAIGEKGQAAEYLLQGQRSPRHTAASDRWLDALSEQRFGEYRLSCDADALFTALRFPEARRVFRRGLVLYPDSSDLWLGLAKLEFASDRRDAAFAAIDRAIVTERTSAQAFAIYGEELCRDRNYERALAVCEQAASRGFASARLELVKARSWLALGDQGKAQEILTQALERYPHATALLDASGDLARAEGDLGRAQERYRRALMLRPLDVSLYDKHLAVSMALRDWEGAESTLARLEQRAPQSEELPRLRSLYWQARAQEYGERDEARAWREALLRSYACHAQSEETFKLVSHQLIMAKEWESLVELVQEGRARLPDRSLMAKVAGIAKLQLGQVQEGLKCLRVAHDLAVREGRQGEAERLAAMIATLQREAGSV